MKSRLLVLYYNFLIYIKFYNKKFLPTKNNSLKPKVLILLYRNIRGTNLLSNEHYNVTNPLKYTFGEKLNIDFFYYDDYNSYKEINLAFYKKLVDFQPDIFILSSYSTQVLNQPSINLLKKYKNSFQKSKVVSLMWDTVWNQTYNYHNKLLKFCDLNVILDGSKFFDKYKKEFSLINLYTVYDSKLFYFDKNIKKDIDVLFLGSVGGYRSNRKEYIDYLIENGVNIYTVENEKRNYSMEEYAELTRRSKIVINFSKSIDGLHQTKGRIYEALNCGALLLESKNDRIINFLDERDFIFFDTKLDLLEKIKFYLNNDSERVKIAQRGSNKAQMIYNEENFWKSIFSKINYLELMYKQEDKNI